MRAPKSQGRESDDQPDMVALESRRKAQESDWKSRGYNSSEEEQRVCETWTPAPEYVWKYEEKEAQEVGYVPWKTTDYPEFVQTVLREFGSCEEVVQGYLVEKAVGDAGFWYTMLSGWLFHSAARLEGCGKTLLIQLQRSFDAIGSSSTDSNFNTSWTFPVAPPDLGKRRMWWSLICDGRDRGNGVTILYKVESIARSKKWSRKKHILTFPAGRITKFLRDVLPLFSWWNLSARYILEDLWLQRSTTSELLRSACTCDTFSFWFLAQGAAYLLKRRAAVSDSRGNFNVAMVHIKGSINALADMTTGQRQALYIQNDPVETRYPHMIWLGAKGVGSCRDLDNEQKRKDLLENWHKHKRGKRSFAKENLKLNFVRGTKDYCPERVALAQVNMRKYSPWRFWFLFGRSKLDARFAIALDWDTKVSTKYRTVSIVYKKKPVIPPGVPAGPWCGNGACKTTSCGSACAWLSDLNGGGGVEELPTAWREKRTSRDGDLKVVDFKAEAKTLPRDIKHTSSLWFSSTKEKNKELLKPFVKDIDPKVAKQYEKNKIKGMRKREQALVKIQERLRAKEA